MPEATLTGETRARLLRVSTATLTTVLFKRGLRNTFIQGVAPLNPQARMVGVAFTLRNIPSREDLDHFGVFDNPDHPQRRAIETIPPGHVLVIDSRQDRRAGTAGGILVTRLMVRGAAGIVTDGGLRDSPDIARMEFPAYAASAAAPANITHHHAVDFNVPIGCGGVPVYPGDILVGDGEGVVVIPADLAEGVAQEAVAMTGYEDWAEAQVRAGRALPGLYPASEASRAEYAAWAERQPKIR